MNTTSKEFHVGRSKEKTADWHPSPWTQGCIHFSDNGILLLAIKFSLLQCGRLCILLRDCCCLLLSSQPWQVWLSSAVLCPAPLQLVGLLFQRGFSLGPLPCTTACTFRALLWEHRWLALGLKPALPGTGTSASSWLCTLLHSDDFFQVLPSSLFLLVYDLACLASLLCLQPPGNEEYARDNVLQREHWNHVIVPIAGSRWPVNSLAKLI